MTLRAEPWQLLDRGRSTEARDALVEAEERVKQRVAELLHGQIQSRLLITSFKIGQCLQLLPSDPDRAASLLHQIRAEVEEIRERDVRHVSHLLHPSVLRVGLMSALRSLARQFDGYFRTQIRSDAQFARLDRVDGPGLPRSWRLICYRIVEECLNNAYFHGKPNNVEVTFRVVGGTRLELSVCDDGRGFEPNTTVPGLGLLTISARAADVAGTVHIDSRPDAGTTVTTQLPLPAAIQSTLDGDPMSDC